MILEQIADDPNANAADRLRAIDLMARYGMGGSVSMDDVKERLSRQLAVLRELLPPALVPTVFEALRSVWR